MTRKCRTRKSDDGDAPKSLRIDLAVAHWKELEAGDEKPNSTRIAKQYAVSKTTLLRRLKGVETIDQVYIRRQRLLPEEETVLAN